MSRTIDSVRSTARTYGDSYSSKAIVRIWDKLNIKATSLNNTTFCVRAGKSGWNGIDIPNKYVELFLDECVSDPEVHSVTYMTANKYPSQNSPNLIKDRKVNNMKSEGTIEISKVRDAVWNFPQGCDDQKEKFLESMDIKPRLEEPFTTKVKTSKDGYWGVGLWRDHGLVKSYVDPNKNTYKGESGGFVAECGGGRAGNQWSYLECDVTFNSVDDYNKLINEGTSKVVQTNDGPYLFVLTVHDNWSILIKL